MKQKQIKKQTSVSVTKKDFDKWVKMNKADHNYFNYKIDTLEKKLDEFRDEMMEFKDSVYNKLDWLVGAFKKFNEEHTVLTEQNKNNSDKLENHEIRIKTLEKHSIYS